MKKVSVIFLFLVFLFRPFQVLANETIPALIIKEKQKVLKKKKRSLKKKRRKKVRQKKRSKKNLLRKKTHKKRKFRKRGRRKKLKVHKRIRKTFRIPPTAEEGQLTDNNSYKKAPPIYILPSFSIHENKSLTWIAEGQLSWYKAGIKSIDNYSHALGGLMAENNLRLALSAQKQLSIPKILPFRLKSNYILSMVRYTPPLNREIQKNRFFLHNFNVGLEVHKLVYLSILFGLDSKLFIRGYDSSALKLTRAMIPYMQLNLKSPRVKIHYDILRLFVEGELNGFYLSERREDDLTINSGYAYSLALKPGLFISKNQEAGLHIFYQRENQNT